MSDDSGPSNRHKKRVVQQGLRSLKNKPGWDPEQFAQRDRGEDLAHLEQKMRDHRVYQEADACADCTSLRSDTGDDTALCQTHMAQAMGFGDD